MKTVEKKKTNSPDFIKRQNKVIPSKKFKTKTLEWAKRTVNSIDKVEVAKAIAWFVNPTIYVTFSVVYFILLRLM